MKSLFFAALSLSLVAQAPEVVFQAEAGFRWHVTPQEVWAEENGQILRRGKLYEGADDDGSYSLFLAPKRLGRWVFIGTADRSWKFPTSGAGVVLDLKQSSPCIYDLGSEDPEWSAAFPDGPNLNGEDLVWSSTQMHERLEPSLQGPRLIEQIVGKASKSDLAPVLSAPSRWPKSMSYAWSGAWVESPTGQRAKLDVSTIRQASPEGWSVVLEIRSPRMIKETGFFSVWAESGDWVHPSGDPLARTWFKTRIEARGTRLRMSFPLSDLQKASAGEPHLALRFCGDSSLVESGEQSGDPYLVLWFTEPSPGHARPLR